MVLKQLGFLRQKKQNKKNQRALQMAQQLPCTPLSLGVLPGRQLTGRVFSAKVVQLGGCHARPPVCCVTCTLATESENWAMLTVE